MYSCHYTAIIASEMHRLRKGDVNFEESFGLAVGLQIDLHFQATFFKGNKRGEQLVPRTSCLR
jgi:hypothetical protein